MNLLFIPIESDAKVTFSPSAALGFSWRVVE